MSDKVKQLNVQVAATEKVLRAVNESVATKIAATISVLKESPDVSQLTTKIHSMQVALTETAKNYEALKTAVGTEQIRATSSAFAATGSVPGHSGTHSPDADRTRVSCPPGSFVSAIQGFAKEGNNPALIQIRYWCRSLP